MNWKSGSVRNLHSILILAGLATGCGGPSEEPREATGMKTELNVYVASYPLQYFAERIGGERVDVRFPAPAGVYPADWSPDAETVAGYQSADLILLNGAEYEKWVSKVSLSQSKLVDTSAGFADRILHVENAVTHSHGPEGEHSHGETASLTWLDMTLAVQQARAIRDAFAKARAESEDYFQGRFESLEHDIMDIDTALTERVAGKTDRRLLAAYPLYPYLARRYQLDIDSLRYDPMRPADMTANDFWHDLEHALEEHKAHWMFWEREPSAETAEKLKGYGVGIVVFDPCGGRPSAGDFLTVMKGNVENLGKAFAQD